MRTVVACIDRLDFAPCHWVPFVCVLAVHLVKCLLLLFPFDKITIIEISFLSKSWPVSVTKSMYYVPVQWLALIWDISASCWFQWLTVWWWWWVL